MNPTVQFHNGGKGMVSAMATDDVVRDVPGILVEIKSELLRKAEEEVRKRHPEAGSILIELVPPPDVRFELIDQMEVKRFGPPSTKAEYTIYFRSWYTMRGPVLAPDGP